MASARSPRPRGRNRCSETSILDCPPRLGQLTTNAWLVADRTVAPVNLTDRHAVKGVNELHRSIAVLREVGASRLPPSGVW